MSRHDGAQNLRIGDLERERAAADLGEHVAVGRLDAEEHAERLDAVWSARTRGDLAILFDDLPTQPPAAPAAREARRGPRVLFPLLALLVVLSVLTHLPLFLVGLGALWFVLIRRGRRLGGYGRGGGCGLSASPS